MPDFHVAALLHGELPASEIGRLWDEFLAWIKASDHVWDDRLCYELYLDDHQSHPEKKFILDICGPVRKA